MTIGVNVTDAAICNPSGVVRVARNITAGEYQA